MHHIPLPDMVYDKRKCVNQGQHKHRIASPMVKHLKFLMRNTSHTRYHVGFRAQCPKRRSATEFRDPYPTLTVQMEAAQELSSPIESRSEDYFRKKHLSASNKVAGRVSWLYKVSHHSRHILTGPNHRPKKKTAPTAPRITTPNAGDQYRSAGNRYPR